MRPGLFIQNLRTGVVEYEELTTHWSRFFPSVAQDEWETYSYPMPLSEQFWHEYAEPIDDFISEARLLITAIEALSRSQPLREADHGELRSLGTGRRDLNALLGSISPSVQANEDGSL